MTALHQSLLKLRPGQDFTSQHRDRTRVSHAPIPGWSHEASASQLDAPVWEFPSLAGWEERSGGVGGAAGPSLAILLPAV
jgi:hypothetical protein